ncbi:MAG: TonB-dependent receptor [Terricaulis sp.]
MGQARRLTCLLSASFAVLTANGVAHAEQSPAPAPTPAPAETQSTDEEDSNDIVVLAERGDQVRIDRRTYTLRDDPVAQSTDMFDVLGRIPSVSVAPDGAITLLGASNVTIQINGQPVPGGNLEQILRGLPGGSVERIEVISNPSAQYSAQASGGIINIITRQRHDAGASGSASVGVNSAQGYLVNVGPSWARGPWTVSLWAGLNHNESERDYNRVRSDIPSGLVTTDTGDINRAFDAAYGWLQVGYAPNTDNNFTLSANVGGGGPDLRQPIARENSFGPVLDQVTLTEGSFEYRALNFDYQHDGHRQREQLKFNLAFNQSDNDNDQTILQLPAASALSSFATHVASSTESLASKLDYETPLGQHNFLSVGAALDSQQYDVDNNLERLIGAPGVADYATSLNAREETLAAYGTYQIDAGEWTILPGVRAESYRREVVGAGDESDDIDTRLFPTLHLRRALTEGLNLDLSYSSRISRPALRDLDPTVRFIDTTHAVGGNPNLQPMTTDAFEANLNWQSEGRTFSLTFFDRISDNVTSPFTQQIGAVTLYTQANAGSSDQRGLQVIWRGPLAERWRYSLSGSALSNEFDTLNGASITRSSELEYSGSVQLEYRDPEQGRVGANNFALDVRFNGPTHSLQGETEASTQTNLTWRRRLTPEIFGVLIVQDVFSSDDAISTTTTGSFVERTETQSQGVRLRLALTYQWGAGSDRMQDRSAPGGGAPSQ